MTAMAAEETPKKKTRKRASPEQLRAAVDAGVDAANAVLGDTETKLHVVEEPKPKPKPGAKGFDWQTEYPGEEVYVYTVPAGAKSPAG